MTGLGRLLLVAASASLLAMFGFQSGVSAQTGAGTVTVTATIDLNLNIEQEQEQTQNQAQLQDQDRAALIPVRASGVRSAGGKALPKTGVDAAEVGGIGTATLVAGATLMEFARRRRRSWIAPTTAAEARATTTKLAPEPQQHGSSEGDLLLPYAPHAGQITKADAQRPADQRDLLTPGF